MKASCVLVALTCWWTMRTWLPNSHSSCLSIWNLEKLSWMTTRARLQGNGLGALPRGKQTLGGMEFKVGPGLIQLGSKTLNTLPANMDGIQVKQKFAKLNILHATCFGGGPNEEGRRMAFRRRN